MREGLIATVRLKWTVEVTLEPGDEVHLSKLGMSRFQLTGLMRKQQIDWGEIQRDIDTVLAANDVPVPSLYGSSVLPAVIEIAEGVTIQLGELVAAAHQASGLTIESWNGLPDLMIEALLSVKLAELQAEAGQETSDTENEQEDKQPNGSDESDTSDPETGEAETSDTPPDESGESEQTSDPEKQEPDEGGDQPESTAEPEDPKPPADPDAFVFDPDVHHVEHIGGGWHAVFDKEQKVTKNMREDDLYAFIGIPKPTEE